MSQSDFQAIRTIIASRFVYEGELTPETRFIEDIGADSLDVIELSSEIEKLFSITIPLGDLIKMQKISDVVDYIGTRHGG